MTDLQQLKLKRKVIRQSITRFEKILSNFSDSDNIEVLKIKFNEFQNTLKNYNEIQDKIALLSEISEAEEEERVSEEDKICQLLVQAQFYLKEDSGCSDTTHTQQTLVKLPTINLPKFDGEYTQWATFYTTFESLIHNNNSLDLVQKLHYLRSCLGNEPLRIIESLQISPESYDPAWRLLRDRYENKRLIVQHHIHNLFALPENANDKLKLRLLLDKTNVHLEALKSMNINTESWDPILIYLLTQKFDSETNREWEATLTNTELPSLERLKDFIKQKCQILESFDFRSVKSESNSTLGKDFKVICPKCKKFHFLFQCSNFLSLSENERFTEAKRLNVCINCLKQGHDRLSCKSAKCKKCNAAHHTMLHFEKKVSNKLNAHSSNKAKEILLSTAIILVKDSNGTFQKARALLDAASQQNFVTEKFAEFLNLRKNKRKFTISGIGGSQTKITFETKIDFKSNLENYSKSINCLIIPQITDPLPSETFDISILKIPQNITFADPDFYISSEIDILIGAELFYDILRDGRLQVTQNRTYLQNSVLGWLIGGPYQTAVTDKYCTLLCNKPTNEKLESQIAKLWEIDTFETVSEKTLDENECEAFFKETTTRDTTGRFIVRLPLRNTPINIGSTKELALRRLKSLIYKFKYNTSLKNEYYNFLNEYLRLGHMEQIEEVEDPHGVVYLPHHAVVKQSSLTTKIRVVFDGSARSTNGLSLNNNLLPGPNLQADLFSLLTKCRFHKFALSADIKKMFRQILVHPDDRDLLRILFKEKTTDNIIKYRLKTVTYGLNCAPFLAMRCLKELAMQASEKWPEASQTILNCFYMDDLLVGVDSVAQGIKLRDEIIEILKQGGFELYKWASNNNNLLPQNEKLIESHMVRTSFTNETKTLGLIWNCKNDSFKYQLSEIKIGEKISKREALSIIAQIFDPMGLLCPMLVTAKLIIQQLWSLKLSWDEKIPDNIFRKFQRFCFQIANIDKIEIPRFILQSDSKQKIELHGFCDASKNAYGAVIYIRTISDKGDIKLNVLCAKSRVAPLKPITIPRLELCAALLLAKLYYKVISIINTQVDDYFLWGDSKIVLAWLAGDPTKWQTFIAHRVKEIHKLSNKNNWKYIPSNLNPADMITRGINFNETEKIKNWFNGPTFLLHDKITWPIQTSCDSEDEIKSIILASVQIISGEDKNLIVFNRISKFSKLRRVFAYCLRFIYNCRNPSRKLLGVLTVDELQTADKNIVKLIQSSEFQKEIQALKNKNFVSSPNLLSLNLFLDDSGILRVGGRLKNSKLMFETKHPILLPKSHPLTKMIIRDIHCQHLHAGVQATVSAVRQTYWPLSLKSTTRKVIHECVRCCRVQPVKYEELMGDLPSERVNPARPFENSGVDYAGPFLIRESKGRGKKSFKAYVAVFVCLVTRAIHLELVHDYSAESFLGALKRMMARRGKIRKLFSDNGSNFVRANKELKALKSLFDSKSFQNKILDHLTYTGIEWKFIPPNSPYVGGIWEAAVKSFKKHFKRVAFNTVLTVEEMYTLLALIEACLNSRPITPISDDPNDFEALTPGHFLVGGPLTALPELAPEVKSERLLSRWQKIEIIRQEFWRRWSTEYLRQLQQRPKWRKRNKQPFKVGSLVLIRDENQPPMKWKMGRIVELHPGKDGITRVVTIQTISGKTSRAVGRLCPLPVEEK